MRENQIFVVVRFFGCTLYMHSNMILYILFIVVQCLLQRCIIALLAITVM